MTTTPPPSADPDADAGTTTFRVKIRGEFKDLTDAQRRVLLAEAADHDPFHVAWLPEGHLSYELSARPFFTFRFAIEAPTDRTPDAVEEAATALARRWLDERGLGYRLRTSQTDDLSKMPLAKRQRRDRTAG